MTVFELTALQREWIAVAQRVLAGEFKDADGSTRKSLIIGLRGIENEDCVKAVEILRDK